MVDPAFKNINRLLVISFKNGDNDPVRNSFGKYYMRLGEIKDFNALIEISHCFLSNCEKQTKSVLKTCQNVKK